MNKNVLIGISVIAGSFFLAQSGVFGQQAQMQTLDTGESGLFLGGSSGGGQVGSAPPAAPSGSPATYNISFDAPQFDSFADSSNDSTSSTRTTSDGGYSSDDPVGSVRSATGGISHTDRTLAQLGLRASTPEDTGNRVDNPNSPLGQSIFGTPKKKMSLPSYTGLRFGGLI